MSFIECNPIQALILRFGGLSIAVAFRVATVLVAFALSRKCDPQNSWMTTRILVLIHVWLVMSYAAYLFIVDIETKNLEMQVREGLME